MNATARPAAPKLPGTIDTLGHGYRIVNRHPYLLLLPIMLDFFYWLGPRLSLQPVAVQAAQALDRAAATAAISPGSQAEQSWTLLKSILDSTGQSLNLFSLLSTALAIPSVLTSQDLAAPSWLGAWATSTINTPSELTVVALLLLFLGVLLGATYLTLAAHVVRDGQVQPALLLRRVLPNAGRFILLMLGALVAALFIGLPLAMFVGMAALLSPLIGTVLMVGLWAGLLWVYLYLFFTINAIFVSDAGPLRAIMNSVTVVRLSTSSAIGFFFTLVVISLGIPYVWGAFGASEMATVVGIAGSAYIGTGLTVASMIFYRDRIAFVRNQVPAVRGAVPDKSSQ